MRVIINSDHRIKNCKKLTKGSANTKSHEICYKFSNVVIRAFVEPALACKQKRSRRPTARNTILKLTETDAVHVILGGHNHRHSKLAMTRGCMSRKFEMITDKA